MVEPCVDGESPRDDADTAQQSVCSADDVKSRSHAPAHGHQPSAV